MQSCLLLLLLLPLLLLLLLLLLLQEAYACNLFRQPIAAHPVIVAQTIHRLPRKPTPQVCCCCCCCLCCCCCFLLQQTKHTAIGGLFAA